MKSEEEYERIKKKLKMLEKESKNNYFLEYEKNLLESKNWIKVDV